MLGELRRYPQAEIRFNTKLCALSQVTDGVVAELEERDRGRRYRVAAGYVIGADRAHSPVRQATGVAMSGEEHLGRELNILFEADLASLVQDHRASLYLVHNREMEGVFRPVNEERRWTLTTQYVDDPRAVHTAHPRMRRGTLDPAVPPRRGGMGARRGSRGQVRHGRRLPGRRCCPSHDTRQRPRRAPHHRLDIDGRRLSTIDLFDGPFVLLSPASGWCAAAQQAASRLRVPLATRVIDDHEWARLYGVDRGALLVRPDGHVAWRTTGTAESGTGALEDILSRVLGLRMTAEEAIAMSVIGRP